MTHLYALPGGLSPSIVADASQHPSTIRPDINTLRCMAALELAELIDIAGTAIRAELADALLDKYPAAVLECVRDITDRIGAA